VRKEEERKERSSYELGRREEIRMENPHFEREVWETVKTAKPLKRGRPARMQDR